MKNKIMTMHDLDRLIEKVHPKIYAHILFKSNYDEDLTEDICQEAYEKVINKIQEGKYTEEDKFKAWVMIIAKNLLTDHYRKEVRFRNVNRNGKYSFDDFIKFADYNPREWHEEDIDVVDIEKRVNKLLHKQIKKLPEPQAHVLKLVFFEGYSYKRIAEEYDMSINTALGRMRYALINLRKLNKTCPELEELALKQ